MSWDQVTDSTLPTESRLLSFATAIAAWLLGICVTFVTWWSLWITSIDMTEALARGQPALQYILLVGAITIGTTILVLGTRLVSAAMAATGAALLGFGLAGGVAFPLIEASQELVSDRLSAMIRELGFAISYGVSAPAILTITVAWITVVLHRLRGERQQ